SRRIPILVFRLSSQPLQAPWNILFEPPAPALTPAAVRIAITGRRSLHCDHDGHVVGVISEDLRKSAFVQAVEPRNSAVDRHNCSQVRRLLGGNQETGEVAV